MAHKVLIVDDERSLRRTLTFVFGRADCEVREAENGDEAVSMLRQEAADLVVMDVMMPTKSGFEALSEIRADPALQPCRVIILTAKGQEADRQEAFARGADEFMTKPFSPARVAEVGRELLEAGPRPALST